MDPGFLLRGALFLEERAEGTYKTKHAEAARLNYTTTTHRHRDTDTKTKKNHMKA